MTIEDKNFIQRLKAKVPADWKRLFRENDKQIFNLAMKTTHNVTDAEDVRADVYKKFLEGIEAFKGDCAVGTYLHFGNKMQKENGFHKMDNNNFYHRFIVAPEGVAII